jgi:hypothetical protein
MTGDAHPADYARPKRAAINALRDIYRAILILEGARADNPEIMTDSELQLDIELCRDRLSTIFDKARGVRT